MEVPTLGCWRCDAPRGVGGIDECPDTVERVGWDEWRITVDNVVLLCRWSSARGSMSP